MPTVSELISNNISNAQTNIKNWKDIIYNVKDYGAKGDGTTDDTAAIQTLINSLDNGGNVYFPPGQYIITKTISLKNDIHLTGASSSVAVTKGSNIVFRGNGVNAIELLATTSRENVKIMDIGILNESTNPANGINVERFTNQCSIENVMVRGFKNNIVVLRSWYASLSNIDSSYALAEGIILSRTNGISLTNIRSRNCVNSGLMLTNDCDNLSIIGGAFESNTHGIKVYDCKAINISTYFEANTTYDIYLSANTGGGGKGINVFNSFFNPMIPINETTQQNSINVESSETVNIQGNYFAPRIAASVRVGSASKDVLITNNFYVEPTKILTDLGTRTRVNEPQLRMDILIGRLLDNLDANYKSILNLSELKGRDDKPLDLIGNGQTIRINYSNTQNTDIYFGTGKVATFDGNDLRFQVQGKGIVVKDKATGSLYRIVVNNGTLGIEPTT